MYWFTKALCFLMVISWPILAGDGNQSLNDQGDSIDANDGLDNSHIKKNKRQSQKNKSKKFLRSSQSENTQSLLSNKNKVKFNNADENDPTCVKERKKYKKEEALLKKTLSLKQIKKSYDEGSAKKNKDKPAELKNPSSPKYASIISTIPFKGGEYRKPESIEKNSDRWSMNYQSVREILKNLDLSNKNDQIVQLLFKGAEGEGLAEVEEAYRALLSNNYDITTIEATHGIHPSNVAQKYGRPKMAEYIEKIEQKFLEKHIQKLNCNQKINELEKIINRNWNLRQEIISSAFEKNFELVNNALIDDIFKIGAIKHISDVVFPYEMYRILVGTNNTKQVLKRKHDESLEKRANIYRFNGTYLVEFNKQQLVDSSKIEERLTSIEEQVGKAKIAKASELMKDQELATTKEIINNQALSNDKKIFLATKLLIFESLFSHDVIAFLKANSSETDSLTLIEMLLADKELMKQAYDLTKGIDPDVPSAILEIIDAEVAIDQAKKYLEKKQIREAGESLAEAEEYFLSWARLWKEFDKKMSEIFGWQKFPSQKANNFRMAFKKIFNCLSKEEAEDKKLKEDVTDKKIDWSQAWFVLDKNSLLTCMPTQTETKKIEELEEELKNHERLKELNELVNMDEDFFSRLELLELDHVRQQKALLEFALRNENLRFFNIKRLLNWIFFPSPDSFIGKNIFLDRPLFKGDEKFADLF